MSVLARPAGLGPIYQKLLNSGVLDERMLILVFLVVERLRGKVDKPTITKHWLPVLHSLGACLWTVGLAHASVYYMAACQALKGASWTPCVRHFFHEHASKVVLPLVATLDEFPSWGGQPHQFASTCLQDSPYAPWIALLQSDFDTPLHYTDAELRELRGTNLHSATRSQLSLYLGQMLCRSVI
jgi:hypothetical protein